jgi:NDP-sugar pyrophosphorylase family protein
VILAAGSGERARPLTEVLPKALVNVAGATLLERALDGLSSAGLHEITVAIGYRASMIESYLKSRKYRIDDERDIDVVNVQDYEIGPLRTALTAINSFTEDEFLISPVDAVVSPDVICGMIEEYSKNPKSMMLAIDFFARSGTTVSINGNGHIVNIGDVLPSTKTSTAKSAMLLIANKTLVAYCEAALARGESRLVSVLNAMIRDGIPIYTYNVKSTWFDVDSISDILQVNRYLLAEPGARNTEKYMFVPQHDLMEIDNQIEMKGLDIIVEKDVVLRGPVLLSSGIMIAENCRIGPNVTIGSSVRIANDCEIMDSLVQDGSRVEAGRRISNSIVFGNQIYRAEM